MLWLKAVQLRAVPGSRRLPHTAGLMEGLLRSPSLSPALISWYPPLYEALHTSRWRPHLCLCSTIPPPSWHSRSFLTWPCLLLQSCLANPGTHATLSCPHTFDNSFRDCLTPYRTLSISDPETLNANSTPNCWDDPKHPWTFLNALREEAVLTLIEICWQSPFLNTWSFLSKSFPSPGVYL